MIRATIALTALASVVVASSALASDDSDRDRADGLFKDGLAASRAGDLERARRLFAASFELVQRPGTLGNLGETEVRLGRVVEGLGHLRSSLAMLGTSDPRRAVVQQDIDEACAKTGHLSIHAVRGATVSVDGSPVPGVAPLADPVDVLPGHRVVEARLAARTVRREVDAPAGSIVDVDLSELPRVPEPQPPSPPPPQVAIPIAPEPEQPGREGASWWTAPRIAGLGLGAGAVGAGVAALVFHGLAQSASADGNGLRANLSNGSCVTPASSPECASLQSKSDTVHADDVAKTTSWVLAGTFAVGSVVSLVLGAVGPARSPVAATSLRLSVGPGGMGLEGQFH